MKDALWNLVLGFRDDLNYLINSCPNCSPRIDSRILATQFLEFSTLPPPMVGMYRTMLLLTMVTSPFISIKISNFPYIVHYISGNPTVIILLKPTKASASNGSSLSCVLISFLPKQPFLSSILILSDMFFLNILPFSLSLIQSHK